MGKRSVFLLGLCALLVLQGCVVGRVRYVDANGAKTPAVGIYLLMRECDTCSWKITTTDSSGYFGFDPYQGDGELPVYHGLPSGEAYDIVAWDGTKSIRVFHRPDFQELITPSGTTQHYTVVPDIYIPAASVSQPYVDSDGDEVTDHLEVHAYGTDPNDPDTDADGLADSTELYGLNGVDYRGLGADPLRRDVFYEVDYYETEEGKPFLPDYILSRMTTVFGSMPILNPDGIQGVNLWLIPDQDRAPTAGLTCRNEAFMSPHFTGRRRLGFRYIRHCPEGGDAGVAQYPSSDSTCSGACSRGDSCEKNCQTVAEGVVNLCQMIFPDDQWNLFLCVVQAGTDLQQVCLPACVLQSCMDQCEENDFNRAMGARLHMGGDFKENPVTPAEHKQSAELYGGLLHEIGHTLWITHGGGDDPNYKPNYTSLMNYSFRTSFNGPIGSVQDSQVHFSDGRLDPLDERYIREVMPFVGEGDFVQYLRFYNGADSGFGFDVSENPQNPGEYDVNWDRSPNGAISQEPLPNVRVRASGPGFAYLRDYNDLEAMETGIAQGVPFAIPDAMPFDIDDAPTYTLVRYRGAEQPPNFEQPTWPEVPGAGMTMPLFFWEQNCLGGNPEESTAPQSPAVEPPVDNLSRIAEETLSRHGRFGVSTARMTAAASGVSVEDLQRLAAMQYTPSKQPWHPRYQEPRSADDLRRAAREHGVNIDVQQVSCAPRSPDDLRALLQHVTSQRPQSEPRAPARDPRSTILRVCGP